MARNAASVGVAQRGAGLACARRDGGAARVGSSLAGLDRDEVETRRFATDPIDPDVMKRPPRRRGEALAGLSAVVVVSFGLQIAAHHVELLRALLQTSILPRVECAALVGVALVPIVVLEIAKVFGAARQRGVDADDG